MEKTMGKTEKLFSDRELSDFCGHLAMILNSGISVTEGLMMMEEDLEDRKVRDLLKTLEENVEDSGLLWQAMEAAAAFPDYMIRMVKLGEQSGHLDDVMTALSDHYDREDSLRRSIRSAVAYPAVMLLMMAGIILVLLTHVMPIFNQVFLQLGSELTGLSRSLMDLGTGIRKYAVVLVEIAAVLVLVGLWFRKSQQGRTLFNKLGRNIPWLRKLWDRIALCRFSSGMSLTLSSGLNPEYALELTRELSQDPDFKMRLELCHREMEQGEDLSKALMHAGVFTGVYARMASIGERTGAMDQALRQVADDCQNRLDQQIAQGLSLIEPTLVVILSVIVGVILMSVMFPLLGIMSSL